MISKTAIIHENVKLGENCFVEDFVVVGAPPRGTKSGELETVIGDNAVIRSHTVIYAGNKIGNNFQTGNKVNVRELNDIGDSVSIGTLSVVEHHVKIGNGVRIHTQAFVPEYTTLEEGCWVGPNVVITNASYPNLPTTKESLRGVTIKRRAIVGANSTLMPGVVIGECALVGSGAVVTKAVAPRAVVVGNPAKQVKMIDDIHEYKEYR
ncbi:MAG: transferase [Candidatus Liptonbacteria bacterium]|nr:transferase [Candidatus Liptonbacteria bacterium]